MSAGDITGYVAVAVAFLGTVFIPWTLRRRRRKAEASHAEALTLGKINDRLDKERGELQRRLDTIDAHYIARIDAIQADCERQINAVQADCDRQLDALRARVKELEANEVVYKRMIAGGSA